MLSRDAVATMAALCTAACRAAAFVPTFASNAAILGSGRARHMVGAPVTGSSRYALRRRLTGSSNRSSLVVTAGREGRDGLHGSVRVMMSGAQDTAEAETLTASIKAKGDEIRT